MINRSLVNEPSCVSEYLYEIAFQTLGPKRDPFDPDETFFCCNFEMNRFAPLLTISYRLAQERAKFELLEVKYSASSMSPVCFFRYIWSLNI